MIKIIATYYDNHTMSIFPGLEIMCNHQEQENFQVSKAFIQDVLQEVVDRVWL
jgi:hypothetical protein